jgi:phosphohistidine swiveling domain-containing protein
MHPVLKELPKLIEQYRDDIEYFNYPGVVFYLSGSIIWLAEALKDYYGGVGLPFVVGPINDGAAYWEIPMSRGCAEIVMQQIEDEGEEFLIKHRQLLDKTQAHLEDWLQKNPFKADQDLVGYIDRLRLSNEFLFNDLIHFQISTHVPRLLTRKISEVFKNSRLSDHDIFTLCLPEEQAEVHVHEKTLQELLAWTKVQKIDLNKSFRNLYKNKDFISRLKNCFELGYFLHVSYGGVTLWSLEKEFNELKKLISQENNSQASFIGNINVELTSEQSLWVKAQQHYAYARDRRKTLQQKIYYYQAQNLEVIGKLVDISRQDLEQLLESQITPELFSNRKKLFKLIEEQRKMFIFIWTPSNGFYFETGYEGLRVYERIKTQQIEKVNELKGQIASKGWARGKVRIIFNTHRQVEFNEGDILVTGMTAPDFVPLMKQAGAIVTDKGGVTSHAAIISRELGKPCIIDTIKATQVFKDGDEVEVDANNGVVRIIK